MVLRDYTAELILPSVPVALALASIFSNQMTVTSQQHVKMIAQVVLSASRRDSGQS